MRVQGPNAATVATSTSKARRSESAGGFSLASEETAQSSAAPSATLRTIGGIDALIALQGDEEPGGKKRRAVKRGRAALDALDDLKHGLLAGSLDQAALLRLKSVASELKGETGVPGLDSVMAEIELRVEVEIAKFSKERGA